MSSIYKVDIFEGYYIREASKLIVIKHRGYLRDVNEKVFIPCRGLGNEKRKTFMRVTPASHTMWVIQSEKETAWIWDDCYSFLSSFPMKSII